jgi:hypothetical protein
MRRSATARRAAAAAVGVEPTAERRRQAPLVRRTVAIEDEAGRTRLTMVWSGPSTLDRLYDAGRISLAMRRAGEEFHDFFRLAGLDRMRAADPGRVPVQLQGGGPRPGGGGGSEAARLQVATALDALGGWQSPAGSCAWHVLGCEMSLRAWANSSMSWARGRIDHAVACGIMIACLSILEGIWREH